jgi:hypothetical protein
VALKLVPWTHFRLILSLATTAAVWVVSENVPATALAVTVAMMVVSTELTRTVHTQVEFGWVPVVLIYRPFRVPATAYSSTE